MKPPLNTKIHIVSHILAFILFIALNSCKQSQATDTSTLAELKSAKESLHARIAAKDKDIINLQTEVNDAKKQHDALYSRKLEILKSFTDEIKKLEIETRDAKNVIADITKKFKALEKHQLNNLMKEDSQFICSHGPWEKWPKQIEKANQTITKNTARILELKKITAPLSENLEK